MDARGGITRLRSTDYDNNPALYTADDAFSLASYWDRRYVSSPEAFEWYRGYDSLEPLLKLHVAKDDAVLHVGVGTSRLQYQMHLDGFTNVHNVDYSEVCIRQLSELHAGVAGLTYAVADCRAMPQLATASFGCVLDKGTVDALLCGDDDEADSLAMLRECERVLRPGSGVYVCVTYAPPRTRLRYLQRPGQGLAWGEVIFYEVGQQGAVEGPVVAVAGAGRGGRGGEAEGEALAVAAAAAEVEAFPKMGYSHFVYVCTKAAAPVQGT